MQHTLDKLGLLLAFLGVLISGYLIYTHVFGVEIVCGLSSCGVVNGSKYALLLGLPVPLWGLGFYIIVIAMILLKQYRLFFTISIIGALFSAYLTSLEAFVIHAWCQWCIMSAWISLSLLVVSFRLRNKQVLPKPNV